MNKKIGLALGSGGARGIAHIGVIKGLLNLGIEIDMISGSSAGSLIGGLYAAGIKIDEIEKIVSSLDYTDLWKMLDPNWGSGLVKGNKLVEFLNKYLGASRIENLKLPYCAVATNVITAEKVVLDRGELTSAIRASCSVPLVFEPFTVDGITLVDGGVSSPVPVFELERMGADKVIAVNLDAIYFLDENVKKNGSVNPLSVITNSYNILRYHLAKLETRDADIVLEPKIEYVHDFNFAHIESYISSGEEVVFVNKERILALVC